MAVIYLQKYSFFPPTDSTSDTIPFPLAKDFPAPVELAQLVALLLSGSEIQVQIPASAGHFLEKINYFRQ